MDTMINVWSVVERVRVDSAAVELAIFTAILYWFFTSSRVADMLEVVGERVGGWCGREGSSLRQAVRSRRRHHDVYAKLDAENTPQTRPSAGLACARCAPLSRDSWQDAKVADPGAVINILDIGRQTFANGGVVSRFLCDLAQCLNLLKYDYKDVVPSSHRREDKGGAEKM
ncbi:unnamed protein product [Leptidea sinapis]|uniref:Uncharacterized protein n=1 Tax=Leptidea sinapis TaxID=189913 RepID=A0A5E4QGV4_9NEOP|nr:unnamed protein product [Leptidea sinapis]